MESRRGIREANSSSTGASRIWWSNYIAELRTVQPQGPSHPAGASSGGLIVFEMAHQLRTAGQEVGLLGMFDTYGPGYPRIRAGYPGPARRAGRLSLSLEHNPGSIFLLDGAQRIPYITNRFLAKYREYRADLAAWLRGTSGRVKQLVRRQLPRGVAQPQTGMREALCRYVPRSYPGRITLFRATRQPPAPSTTGISDGATWRRKA